MKKLFLILAVFAALGGCASQQPLSMNNDWRTGTDQSPYRSIPTALLCDGCALR